MACYSTFGPTTGLVHFPGSVQSLLLLMLIELVAGYEFGLTSLNKIE